MSFSSLKFIFLFVFFYFPLAHSQSNICLTDFNEILAEDSLEQIKSMRQKANKHCLECGTTSCTLKQWDEANIANQKICNRLFCKPIKRTQKKTLFASSENHGLGQTKVVFSYAINTNGRITDVDIIDLEGEMDKKRALSFLRDNLKALRYEPVEINGKEYFLRDLQGSTGWNIYEK